MTPALLCLSAGLLLWPHPASLPRRRLGAVRGGRPGSGRGAGTRSGRVLPVPVLAGAGAGLAGALVGTLLVGGLAAIGAVLAARAWSQRRRSRHEDARLLALAEALGAFAAELRSGRPREVAVAAAVAGAEQQLARALTAVVRDPAPGAPRPTSPGAGRERAGPGPVEEALTRVAGAIRLSTRTGASLDGVLTAVEEDLRSRHRQRLELRSAVAGPQASALLLAGLPVLGLAMGSGVGADPWAVLTGTGTGQVLLVAGAALEVAGIAWTRRLVARAVGAPTGADAAGAPG